MIIEKKNPIKLHRPKVIIDTPVEPKPTAPLPSKNGFCISIVGPAGSGKTSVMLSLVKSKEGYRKRFHKIIAVIPESSLNSLNIDLRKLRVAGKVAGCCCRAHRAMHGGPLF